MHEKKPAEPINRPFRKVPRMPAPQRKMSIVANLRNNLFATYFDSIITVFLILFCAWAVWHVIRWGVLTAVFSGSDREACLAGMGESVGACWTFVRAKLGQFLYGLYPLNQRWRLNLVYVLLVILALPFAVPSAPGKTLNAVLLFAVFPLVALVLLTGGHLSISGGWIALLLALSALFSASIASASVISSRWTLSASKWLAMASVLVLFADKLINNAGTDAVFFRFSVSALIAVVLAFMSVITSFASLKGNTQILRFRVALPPLVAVLVIGVLSGDFGLATVPVHLWGGLSLTLVVALSGITASLPLGILLALGRRSHLPAVRLFSVLFIEFWRGVPLITVLFMAAFMIPLFLPEGMTVNNLLRALIGFTLFSAAYMAEVIRGGLQAIEKGQYEGAEALGLSYWPTMQLVIMPQALKLVIPSIVNIFIGMFKDTSLIYTIGLSDFLGTVRRGFSDPGWITPVTPVTGLVFAAFVYWIFCFGMSRYSIFVERQLETGRIDQ